MFFNSMHIMLLWNTVLIFLEPLVIAFHDPHSEMLSLDLQRRGNATELCSLDQSRVPGNLTFCGNSSLFSIWRPKARFIAPEGWMNDPQGLFQRRDGSIHVGYQCRPQHYTWGNISQCAATSADFVYWEDMNSWQDPRTIWPSEIYDIRGVFDGSIIKDGWEGYPTTIYVSTFPGPLGATSDPPEVEGIETQSIAYTKDEGKSWIKLHFGPDGNPVIYEWPMPNLTGFRDPYAFLSPTLFSLLDSTTNDTSATGDHFLTISSGVRSTASGSSSGPRLLLYRQTKPRDVRHWTYLGPLISVPAMSSFSDWSGNFGINFETACVARLNEQGDATNGGDGDAVMNFIGLGTEEGRNGSHENHWPLWASVTYESSVDGGVSADIVAVGVIDWGRAYATVTFPIHGNRSVLVGWTYEDDEDLVLARQRGYQGALTLFRDLFVKVIRNVDPRVSDLHSPGSWTVRKEADGSTSVVTLGQRIVPEITSEYKRRSKVSYPEGITLKGTAGFLPFWAAQQPGGRHYALLGTIQWIGGSGTDHLPLAGFRVLASDQEWTDIYFDPRNETLVVDRSHSSLVPSYGKDTEYGKLRLWPIKGQGQSTEMQTLNLAIIVDNSVVEVYANDVTVLTTRVYPWLSASKSAGFYTRCSSISSSSLSSASCENNGGGGSVRYSGVEIWDGLVDAWPKRPEDTRKPLLWSGALSEIWGLWPGY